MFLRPNRYPVHPYTLSEVCVCVCVCACVRACVRACTCAQRFLSLPAPAELHRAKAYKFSPTLSLIMKSLIGTEFSKDHLSLYEQVLIAAMCQRRAKGSASKGHCKTGCSHNPTIYLLYSDYHRPLFYLQFEIRLKQRESSFMFWKLNHFQFCIGPISNVREADRKLRERAVRWLKVFLFDS